MPNLVAAAARNFARKQEDGALFELGPRYIGDRPGEQVVALAGLRYGEAAPRHWATTPRPVDAIDTKGDALTALSVLGVKPESLQVVAEAPCWYHPGRSGSLRQGRAVLATFGELHPRARGLFDLAASVAVFELDLDAVPMPKARAGKARPMLEPMPYPPVDRDFAFIVEDKVRAGDVVDAGAGLTAG